MGIIDALILGFVQGITEFLPVSSSGHLILTGKILGLSSMPVAFELMTHLATLLAVLIALRKSVFGLIKKPLQKTNALILTATVPTVIIFFVFKSFFESTFDGGLLIYCFGATAIILFVTGMIQYKKPKEEITFLDAAIIGVAQGVAGLPGVSRSGITICSARLLGTEQNKSAEFSFLLSIPIIIGSAGWELVSGGFSLDISVWAMITGFISAFITGLVAVKFMLKFIGKHSMNGFAVYLIILVLFLTVNDFALHLF